MSPPVKPDAPDTKTGSALKESAAAFAKEMEDEVLKPLQAVHTKLQALASVTGGVNGTATFLKAKATELVEMEKNLRQTTEEFGRNLLGIKAKAEITERVAHPEAA